MIPQGLIQHVVLRLDVDSLLSLRGRLVMGWLECLGIPSGLLRYHALSEVVQILLKVALHVLDRSD